MDVFRAIETRRSIRRYKLQHIADETLSYILEAARLAPSASGRQPWELIVVRRQETKKSLARVCNDLKFVEGCDVFIAGIGDPAQPWYITDLSIALEHVVLAAWALGIGSCWLGSCHEDGVKYILKIPPTKKLVACLTLGYPDEAPDMRPRKNMADLVRRESYE